MLRKLFISHSDLEDSHSQKPAIFLESNWLDLLFCCCQLTSQAIVFNKTLDYLGMTSLSSISQKDSSTDFPIWY